MTIKQRLSLTLSLLTLLIVTVGVINMTNQRGVAVKSQIAQYLSDVDKNVYAARLYQRYTMMEPSNKSHADTTNTYLDIAEDAARKSLSLMKLKESRRQAAKVIDNIDTFRRAFNRYALALQQHKSISQSDSSVMVSSAKDLSSTLQKIKEVQRVLLEEKNALTTRINLLILTFASVVSIFAGFWLYKTISHSLKEIGRVVSLLSEGDLTQQVRIEGNDELSSIGMRLNESISELRHLISSVKSATGELGHSVIAIGRSLHESMKTVNMQHSETELVATAVTEMASATDEIAHNATETSNQNERAYQLIESGKAEVSDNVESILLLGERIVQSSNLVEKLSADNKHVDQILITIRNIAEQTNLLALNAAIEAARAGEQGRGFAVVADEVRQLAQRTQTSIEEIAQIIDSITSGTTNVVEVMNTSREDSARVIERIQNVGTLFEQVAEAITVINDMNTQISVGTEEQSAVAKEVSDNINKIKVFTDENQVKLEGVTADSDSQTVMLGVLNKAVERFIV